MLKWNLPGSFYVELGSGPLYWYYFVAGLCLFLSSTWQGWGKLSWPTQWTPHETSSWPHTGSNIFGECIVIVGIATNDRGFFLEIDCIFPPNTSRLCWRLLLIAQASALHRTNFVWEPVTLWRSANGDSADGVQDREGAHGHSILG